MGDPPELVADARLAKVVLDWQPKYVDIQRIIETAWNWHQHHPHGYQSHGSEREVSGQSRRRSRAKRLIPQSALTFNERPSLAFLNAALVVRAGKTAKLSNYVNIENATARITIPSKIAIELVIMRRRDLSCGVSAVSETC